MERLVLYEGNFLSKDEIKRTIEVLNGIVVDETVEKLICLYQSFLDLIWQQESSDCEEPETECVYQDEMDNNIHYWIDEDYDIVIYGVR